MHRRRIWVTGNREFGFRCNGAFEHEPLVTMDFAQQIGRRQSSWTMETIGSLDRLPHHMEWRAMIEAFAVGVEGFQACAAKFPESGRFRGVCMLRLI